jgi:hypothetical protein
MAFLPSGLLNTFKHPVSALKKGLGKTVRFPGDGGDRTVPLKPRPILPEASGVEGIADVAQNAGPTNPYDSVNQEDQSFSLSARPPKPQSEYERLVNLGRRISTEKNIDENGNIINKPGRFKSGLMQALNAVGEAARRNVAAGRTDWNDLAGVAGAGAGGLGVGIADPGLIVKARHEKAVEANRQAQEDELGRMSGLARIKGVEAEASRDEAYAAAHTPEALQAKAESDQKIKDAKSYTEAVKELDDIAQKGADPEYLQTRASEIQERFGKPVNLPKYAPKAEGGFSLPPGGVRYDSQGNAVVQNTNPTPGQVEAVTKNADDIGKAEAEKRQMEAAITTAKDRATNEEKNVQTLEANKPKWDQTSADNEETGTDYVKKYNKELEQWQKRRDKAQTDLETAVKAQKDAESKYAGSYVPQTRSLPTPANVTPQTFTMKDIEARAKAAGQTVEAYKARVLEIYPNAKFK